MEETHPEKNATFKTNDEVISEAECDEELLSNIDETDIYDDFHSYEDYEEAENEEDGNYQDNTVENKTLGIQKNFSFEKIIISKKCPKKLLRTPKCAR